MWYAIRYQRKREDRIYARERLLRRYQVLHTSHKKAKGTRSEGGLKHVSFSGEVKVCRFDKAVSLMRFSLRVDSSTHLNYPTT